MLWRLEFIWINVSNIMDLCNQLCSSVCLFISQKFKWSTLDANFSTRFFSYLPCLQAPLTFIQFSVALTLPEGLKVSGKENLLSVFSGTLLWIGQYAIWCVVEAVQTESSDAISWERMIELWEITSALQIMSTRGIATCSWNKNNRKYNTGMCSDFMNWFLSNS